MRRLFSSQIVESDAFLEMPVSAQNLYFHLGMIADDDGFVDCPKKTERTCGANGDDLKILIGKRFVLSFKSGIVVIKHWLIHNSIRKDRYTETKYIEEKSTLLLKENNSYTEDTPENRENLSMYKLLGNQSATSRQPKLSKVKLSKVKLSKDNGDKSPTPQQIAKEFFNNTEKQIQVLNALEEKYGQREMFELEIKKFIDYWTEPNKSGSRQRWETEKTFEIKRRIANWLRNMKQFQSKKNNIQTPIIL